jgi:ABC-type amino acid transport substrate-binding protein
MRPRTFQLLAVLSLAIAVLAAVILALPSAAQAQKAGTIVVGTSTDPDYPPFEIARGNSVHGFDIDLVKEIGKRIGYKMEVQSTAWATIWQQLAGPDPVFDMLASATNITPDRDEFVDFSDPYYYDAGNPDGFYYYGFAFRTGSPLVALVNSALHTIKEDGTYVKLYHKWFGVAPSLIP